MLLNLLAETTTETTTPPATAPAQTPLEAFWEDVRNFFTSAGLNIVIGIVIIIVGLILCKIIKVILKKIFKRTKKDEAITHFVVSLIDIILKIVVMVSALATMGINTASIITVLGTCGVAIGLALKDSLGNLASGIIIIINKTFKKGDYIIVGAHEGVVQTINLFNTVLLTYDNREVVIPNGVISTSNLINCTAMETRRVDLSFNVAADTDLVEAQNAVFEVASAHELVLDTPSPMCRMDKQGSGCIVLAVKVWTKTENYWDVYFDVTEQVRAKFMEKGVKMPLPQLEVTQKPAA